MRRKGEGMRGKSRSKKARAQERGKGESSSFYSETGTPGGCQVTVGWNLDKMFTVIINHYLDVIEQYSLQACANLSILFHDIQTTNCRSQKQ